MRGLKINTGNKTKPEKKVYTPAEAIEILQKALTPDELSSLARAIPQVKKNQVQWAFLKNYIEKY